MLKVLSFFLIFNSILANAKKISFENLEEYLFNQNQEILGGQQTVQALQERRGLLRRSFMPQLSYSFGGEKFTTGPYHGLEQPYRILAVSQNAYNGGRDQIEGKIIEQQSESAQFTNQSLRTDLLAQSRELYWQSVYLLEVQQTLQVLLNRNALKISKALKRIQAGLSTPTDSLDFEQLNLQMIQHLKRNQVLRENSLDQLAVYLGVEKEQLQLADQVLPHRENDPLLLKSLKVEEHRDIKFLRSQAEIANLEGIKQGRWFLPTLDFYATSSLLTQKDRDYLSKKERKDHTLGFVVKMNIFEGGEAFNLSRSLRQKSQGLEQIASQRSKNILIQFENLKRNIQMIHELVHLSVKNVEKSEDYLSNILKEYDRGIKNSPDVLQAFSRLMDAQMRLIDLKREYHLYRIDCMQALAE